MKRPVRIAAICLTAGGGAVALLLWAKLKLVAGIPRTVYAEPEVTEDTAHPQSDNADFTVQVKDKPAERQAASETPGQATK